MAGVRDKDNAVNKAKRYFNFDSKINVRYKKGLRDPETIFNGKTDLRRQIKSLQKLEKIALGQGYEGVSVFFETGWDYGDVSLKVWRWETDEEFRHREQMLLKAQEKRAKTEAVKKEKRYEQYEALREEFGDE
jgi:hypothetical protein